MSSVPLRARSPFFSFDAENGTRRPRWYVFVAGVLAVAAAVSVTPVGQEWVDDASPVVSRTTTDLIDDVRGMLQ